MTVMTKRLYKRRSRKISKGSNYNGLKKFCLIFKDVITE